MKLNNNDDSHNSGLNLLIYNMLLDIESHPAWVCGLKQLPSKKTIDAFVTPCVGVWIETLCQYKATSHSMSHPAWVCGLKQNNRHLPPLYHVTPCVGVWIETCSQNRRRFVGKVTPCVGVWIETWIMC